MQRQFSLANGRYLQPAEYGIEQPGTFSKNTGLVKDIYLFTSLVQTVYKKVYFSMKNGVLTRILPGSSPSASTRMYFSNTISFIGICRSISAVPGLQR